MKLLEDYTSALADDVVTLQPSGTPSLTLNAHNIGTNQILQLPVLLMCWFLFL
jgi:hypothetical protein